MKFYEVSIIVLLIVILALQIYSIRTKEGLDSTYLGILGNVPNLPSGWVSGASYTSDPSQLEEGV